MREFSSSTKVRSVSRVFWPNANGKQRIVLKLKKNWKEKLPDKTFENRYDIWSDLRFEKCVLLAGGMNAEKGLQTA